jgi:cytochrome oxidase assembly protein ShyY1
LISTKKVIFINRGNMKKPRKQTTFRENTGKVLIDLGKLVFGSIFLGGVLRNEIPQSMLIIGGFAVAIVFCLIGLWWVSKEKKTGEAQNSPVEGGI